MARTLSLTLNQKYTFLADYKYQDWGSLDQQTNVIQADQQQ